LLHANRPRALSYECEFHCIGIAVALHSYWSHRSQLYAAKALSIVLTTCIHNYYILHSATVPTCAVSNYYLLTMACEAVATHQPIEVEVRVGGGDPSLGNQSVRGGRIASALDAVVAIDVGDLEESSNLSDANSLSREHPLILSEMEERLENHMLCTDRDTNDSVATPN